MQLIKHIKASNILSFGPDGLDLPLGSLNILIGANGSGKSNFIELFALLRSTPRSAEDSKNNLQGVIRRGGGVLEWIWKGYQDKPASVQVKFGRSPALLHEIVFRHSDQRFWLDTEQISGPAPEPSKQGESIYYRGELFFSQIKRYKEIIESDPEIIGHHIGGNSILSLRRDSVAYPEISFIASNYEKIRLYREWNFGRNTIFREPQKADLRNDRLEEDFSNLGLYLNQIGRHPQAKRQLVNALRDLYEGLEGYEVLIEGGTVQVFFTEGNFTIPATRLSDGSLRYLCLLAILLDPTPPPLICIEEPELGMHPDMLPKIADLLKDAAQRTQLIVTTHSDILVDAMTDQPESVLVCEKHDGQTSIKRLNSEELTPWLEQYRLGQLWSRGEIGGNRW
ncbi:MAG: AAA family ATPase [Saprospiraceae bacterium]